MQLVRKVLTLLKEVDFPVDIYEYKFRVQKPKRVGLITTTASEWIRQR